MLPGKGRVQPLPMLAVSWAWAGAALANVTRAARERARRGSRCMGHTLREGGLPGIVGGSGATKALRLRGRWERAAAQSRVFRVLVPVILRSRGGRRSRFG